MIRNLNAETRTASRLRTRSGLKNQTNERFTLFRIADSGFGLRVSKMKTFPVIGYKIVVFISVDSGANRNSIFFTLRHVRTSRIKIFGIHFPVRRVRNFILLIFEIYLQFFVGSKFQNLLVLFSYSYVREN